MAGDSVGTFTQALAALKRHGSGLLVTGAAAQETHLAACRRLLGDAGDDRQRLVVLTDGVPGVDDRTSDDAARVIDRRPATRGATAAASPTATDGPSDLVTLEREIVAAIESIEAEAGSLDPAELRVCLDSLRTIVDGHDQREVEQFLAGVLDAVRAVDGMCHVHFPVERDSEATRRFADLFDATIEVQLPASGGDVEQCWHLHDPDISTNWLPL
ncbi:DUF7504 family protein [Halomarina oriensis]|uniref:Uncharacterized protein n=1 Tax=Halomarina oriensis TaxID=671145 RepID=A0A6B0GLH2_9EURY|nr:hypothetical protein [Halomarina oriensis]MWG33633.1 hypothetical protein [Halomarina oriensis]